MFAYNAQLGAALLICRSVMCPPAGLLGRPQTLVFTGEEHTNADGSGRLSIFAAFFDRQQVLAGAAGQTLRLTGYSTDAATGLNVCYEAAVDICAAAPAGGD